MLVATRPAILAMTVFAAPALAHHGFGRFDSSRTIELEGTVVGVDFVNPHAYVRFDVPGANGEIVSMRCEMRSATTLRRSGWSAEMFVPGAPVAITGRPHRDDPSACYVDKITIGDNPELERYQQLESRRMDFSDRPARTPAGEPNIFGEWAQEQYVAGRSPEGWGGLVPVSMLEGVRSGSLTREQVPVNGWGAQPVTLTEAGQAAFDRQRAVPVEETPRIRCEITSILFDWVYDGSINRITRTADSIVMEYGRGLTRTIHMNQESHPGNIVASRAGHSIGRWEGNTLVVDTVGFLPGIVAGNIVHTDRLRVVERFTLDPATMQMRRDYVAEDPLYFASPYVGSEQRIFPADAPFVAAERCEELAPEWLRESGATAAPQ